MAKSTDDAEEKPEGLEIISIGSLYTGTWDKKYWSSSRGKDRYPYPVGYQARRAYNGSNYKMEIQEGLKGPLFLINSADGHLCSGQTPDIAWEKFQKKGCPRMKIWHGKRFSCKIDGIEFFGFRNPFVQRLLRELVANVHGIAEQGQQVTRKRGERSEINPNAMNIDGFKKQRGYPACGSEPTGKQLQSKIGEESSHLLVKNALKSVNDPDLLSERAVPADEEDMVANESTGVVNKSFIGKRSSDRLQDTEVEGLNLSAPSESKAMELPFPQDSLSVHDVDLCAPDTLEFEEDSSTNSAPSTLVQNNCGIKEDVLTNVGVSENLVNESQPEKETGTSNLNVDSERSDFDSVHQDITKSMMTVLLPQAIPLLKNASSKNIKTICSSEKYPSGTVEPNNERGFFVEAQSPRIDRSVVQGTECVKPITLEKFDGGRWGDHQVNLSALFPSNAEANRSCFVEDEYYPNAGEQFSDIYVKDSLDSHADTSRSKDAIHDDKSPSGDDLYLSESILGCMAANKKDFTEINQDVCQHLDEKSLVTENTFKDLKPVPDCNEAVGTRNATVGAVASPVLLSMMDTLTEDAASKTEKISSSQVPKKVYTRKKVLNPESATGKSHPPLLEGVTCRKNLGGHDLETKRTLLDLELFYMNSTVDEPHKKEGIVECTQSSLSQPTKFLDNKTSSAKEVQSSSELMMQQDLELDNELDSTVEFLGCYFHPIPILSLVLRRKGNEIFICALCGLLVDESRTLFLYKLVIEEPTAGCPFFVGHTSVTWPSSTYAFDKEIALERSGLQITPDGQFLVLLGSIRTPYCREGKLNCLCSACTLDHFENNSVKIVQLKAGYVSFVSKLETTDSLQCILVVEPDHLIAAGENRRLHLWTMDSRWSSPTEEFIIQSNDYICPCIVEMKRIPKFDSLVIGHNGFGEFTLWDISKRIFISSFSAPSTSVHQFVPISLFSWRTEIHSFSYSNVEAQVNWLMDATKMYFSQHSKNHFSPPLEMEDIGIWFLFKTVCDTDPQHDFVSRDCQINPAGQWRLALLVKNTLILGSALDPRAVAIATSSGQGIIGTHDGLVYMWELLTGKKLGTIHKFEGGSVSCIASDDSGSGVLAVADERGQLLVYQCLKRTN